MAVHQRSIQSVEFPALSGGLNLRDHETRLRTDESPNMLNLWWEDGILHSRPGQEYVTPAAGQGFAASPETFWGYTFLHIGDALCYTDVRDGTLHTLTEGVPENRGTFCRFGDYLFYKNRGGFVRVEYRPDRPDDLFVPYQMTGLSNAYIPTILINADPETAAGDTYQPENRLSPRKRVTYNASCTPRTVIKTGDGTSRMFQLGVTSAQQLRGVKNIYINGDFQESALYSVSTGTGVVIFNSAPPKDATITFTLNIGVLEYRLPVQGVSSIVEVKVDGLTMTAGTDYTADLAAGIVSFTEAPPVTGSNNTVEIVYSKPNSNALNAVMNCPYLAAYGSGTQMCLVAGGCDAQPDAVFWSGSTSTGLDPSYWPMTHYNLVGDTEDRVTGFGRQYGDLLVFKARSIGKLDLSIVELDGRANLSLTYQTVNARVGCDLPSSIQTVENNLVFANTGGGIYQVRSSSAAYENNVDCVSRKVNGSMEHPGLLYDLRFAADAVSLDDGSRYWLAVNGNVWLWDYSISAASDPAFFRFSGFSPVSWFLAQGGAYHLNAAGRITQLGRTFTDYGEAIRKVYRFPVQYFGTYDRLKDVTTVIFSTRADTPSNTEITYETDYGTRKDLTNLTAAGYDRLSERDLSERDLSVPLTVTAFRRRPMCRHVRHFTMTLENNEAGQDLSILTAQIQYRLLGKER